jgi:hypothetical protein
MYEEEPVSRSHVKSRPHVPKVKSQSGYNLEAELSTFTKPHEFSTHRVPLLQGVMQREIGSILEEALDELRPTFRRKPTTLPLVHASSELPEVSEVPDESQQNHEVQERRRRREQHRRDLLSESEFTAEIETVQQASTRRLQRSGIEEYTTPELSVDIETYQTPTTFRLETPRKLDMGSGEEKSVGVEHIDDDRRRYIASMPTPTRRSLPSPRAIDAGEEHEIPQRNHQVRLGGRYG